MQIDKIGWKRRQTEYNNKMEDIGIIFKNLGPWNAIGSKECWDEFFQKFQGSSMVCKLNRSRGKDWKFPGYTCKALTTLKKKTTV